MTNVLPKLE